MPVGYKQVPASDCSFQVRVKIVLPLSTSDLQAYLYGETDSHLGVASQIDVVVCQFVQFHKATGGVCQNSRVVKMSELVPSDRFPMKL